MRKIGLAVLYCLFFLNLVHVFYVHHTASRHTETAKRSRQVFDEPVKSGEIASRNGRPTRG